MRTFIAVIIAGIIGSIATYVSVNLLTGAPLGDLVTQWGGYIVAILVCATFPFIYAALNPAPARFVCLLVAIIVPTVLAITVFAGDNPPTLFAALGFNAIFGLVALIVYNVIAPIPDPI